MAECGFPLTRMMTKAFAFTVAKRSGKDDRFKPETGPAHVKKNLQDLATNLAPR